MSETQRELLKGKISEIMNDTGTYNSINRRFLLENNIDIDDDSMVWYNIEEAIIDCIIEEIEG